jgi:hypothetical protein
MARKELVLTITAEGRDKGKRFFIRELSAMRATRWADRALLALMHSGLELPDDVAGTGMAGIAAMGLRALSRLSFEEAEPLMNEIMACCQIMPDPAHPDVRRAMIEDDIEEVMTIWQLRQEVLMLHLGFSMSASPSTLTPRTNNPADIGSLNTGTFPLQ